MIAGLGWVLWLAAAHACEPLHTADLARVLAEGEAGVADLDEHAVVGAVTHLGAVLPCLVDPLEPVDIAGVHRLEGYGAFVAGDKSAARRAFGAARAADPTWGLTDRLAPPGTELRDLFNASSLDVATEAVSLPPGTALYVDGVRTAERPIDRPAVLQLRTLDGRVLDTVWRTDADPMPDWSRFATAVVLPPPPRPKPTADHRALPWWVGSGVAVLAAGGVYGWAVVDHDRYVDPATGLDEAGLAALRARANTKVMASAGIGAAGVALGVVALVW